VKFGPRKIGEIVRCLPDKKNFAWFELSLLHGRIATKICHGQLPTIYSECSRFHQNRFIFGGVIAERVNTAQTRRTETVKRIQYLAECAETYSLLEPNNKSVKINLADVASESDEHSANVA